MAARSAVRIARREASKAALAALSGLPPLQRRLLASRGIADPGEVDLPLDGLLPPEGFPACQQAAELLADALQREHGILLIGDYDADGATGIAVMLRGLRAMGHANADYIVPDRFRHGYGFCPELLPEIAGRGAKLLVTIDNGMSSIDAIRSARAQGYRVLVLDHHLPGAELPQADCIANPNSPPQAPEFASLAGVGVAFYVLLALRRELAQRDHFAARGIDSPNLAQFLDLVALGTVADLVPLDRNNRILVEQGLRRIRKGRAAPGVIALLRCAKCDPRRVSSRDLAMSVAPRVNAAGRMEKINASIECLLEDRRVQAQEMAASLDRINRQRRAVQRGMEDEAQRALRSLPEHVAAAQVLCLYREEWHEGVVGILASRLRERCGLPAVVFAESADGAALKGSGRSVDGLHLRDALVQVAQREPGLMLRYGGHAMAVGLTLAADALTRFEACLNAAVLDMTGGLDARIRIDTDGPLSPAEMTFENACFTARGQPWGKGFPEPQFEGEFDILRRDTVKEEHLRLQLRHADGADRRYKAMLFFHRKFDLSAVRRRCRIVFGLDTDEFQGRQSCTLIVHHIEPA